MKKSPAGNKTPGRLPPEHVAKTSIFMNRAIYDKNPSLSSPCDTWADWQ
jgi:hypothetical protein